MKPFVKIKQIRKKDRMVKFIPTDLFEAEEVNVVYGKSGVGKTTVMTAIAEAIASGEVGNRSIDQEQGGVLYFAAEGYAHVCEKLKAKNADSDVFVSGGYFDIDGADHISKLATECADKIGMIIIDTLSASMSKGSKNDDSIATKIYYLLKTKLCNHKHITIVLVMHTGKDGKSITGSHQWASDVPVVWKVVKGKLVNEKFRNGAKPSDIYYDLESSDGVQTATINWNEEHKTKDVKLSHFDNHLRDIYDDYDEQQLKHHMLEFVGKEKMDNSFHNKFRRSVEKLQTLEMIGIKETNTN